MEAAQVRLKTPISKKACAKVHFLLTEYTQILIIICGIVACLACATRFYLRVIVKKRAEFVEFILIIAAVRSPSFDPVGRFPLQNSGIVRANLIQHVRRIFTLLTDNAFKVMLLTLIGVQMRIFELIPTIQSPSSFVEAQKVCHYNSTSTHIS